MLVHRIIGAQTVLRNIRNKSASMNRKAESGLKAAGLFLIRESLKLVPVEFGVLKGSWFVRMQGNGAAAKVFLGYTADYAIWVHEDLDAAHGAAYNAKYASDIKAGIKKKRGPNQQAKFLERPMRERRAEALAIIRERMAA